MNTFLKIFILLIFFISGANQFSIAQPDIINPSNSRSKYVNPINDTPTISITDTVLRKKTDKDLDGIPDSLDKCPDEKGVIKFDGCPMPDSDNDGISDDLDDCPNDAGLVKYKGCPIPDHDGDKINDELDKCPDVPGYARFDGCPTRDTDNDGINDDDDKCPEVEGSSTNFGCPETRAYRKILKKQDGKKKSAIPSNKN